MLLSINNENKQHLEILTFQSESVIADFCKLTSQFLHHGPNQKRYDTAAQKLEVDVHVIQNCIYGLVHLLMLACKHKLSVHDFKDSVLALGFTNEQESVLTHFYESQHNELHSLIKPNLDEPHYYDMQWRFEVQLGSRSLLEQVTPLVVMNLSLKTTDGKEKENIEHHLIQTDPTNLLHLTNELERALSESRSRHSRKVEKIINNL